MNESANNEKLLWLVQTLGVKPTQIAALTGKSRPYVARILAGDHTVGSPAFWFALERRLDELVALRTRSFFDLPAVTVEALPKAWQRSLAKCA
jgi:hypothetical protein